MDTAKKTAKDSVFRDLFENPKYLIQLYRALHPEDTVSTEADIGSVTIRNVLLNQPYNDLGFTVGQKLLLLIEAQSTWSVNIVIRILLYLASTWQEYIEGRKLNVYSSRKLELPRPELYVIYTGERGQKPEVLSLKEEFFPDCEDLAVEVRVKVLYGEVGGDIISQYVTFTKVYNEQVKLHGRTREAVLETIRICRDRDVLREYLEDRGKEVVDIMMMLFEQEYAMERALDEATSAAEKQGEIKGEMNKARETAYELYNRKMPVETIADVLKVAVATVQQWFDERAAAAK